MDLDEEVSADDEKDDSGFGEGDMEEIRRVLDEMIESRLKIAYENEPSDNSDSENWKETGIRLLSTSTCRIFDGENNESKEGPPKKRRKKTTDDSSDSEEERAKIRAAVVDVDFMKKFK